MDGGGTWTAMSTRNSEVLRVLACDMGVDCLMCWHQLSVEGSSVGVFIGDRGGIFKSTQWQHNNPQNSDATGQSDHGIRDPRGDICIQFFIKRK